MINLSAYLYEKVKSIISTWDEEDIYAISFYVHSNETYSYQEHSNISEFAISYNTESDCEYCLPLSEERWNYAFWHQNETFIIDPFQKDDEGTKILFQWYKENGIENIGYEDPDSGYDENGDFYGTALSAILSF